MKQTNNPNLIITTDNGIYNTKRNTGVEEKIFNEIPLEQSTSKQMYDLKKVNDTDYDSCDHSYEKENYFSMDFVTKRKPRKSGFVPDVKFRVFNGHKQKQRKKNRKSSLSGRNTHPTNKEQKSPMYDSSNKFTSELVRVEKLPSTQDLNAFELADRLSEAMHEVQCVQENKKESFSEKAKIRHNTALRELQSQKICEEVLDELKDLERFTRFENKKQYSQINSKNEVENCKSDEVQLKMEKIVENILKPEGEDKDNSVLCNSSTSSSNSSPFSSWKVKHSFDKKVYFPPFQQSPPITVERSCNNDNDDDIAREPVTQTDVSFPNDVMLYQQQLLLRAKERKELMDGLFSPISVPSTSTPNSSPQNSKEFLEKFENSLNGKDEEGFTPSSECNYNSPDSTSESNFNSSQDILKAFLSKRGLLGSNLGYNSPNLGYNSPNFRSNSPNLRSNSPYLMEEHSEEKSVKKAFCKKKFFTDPNRLSTVSNNKFEVSPETSTLVHEEQYSKALSEAAKELEISEIKLKICQKEKEKIEEEQDFLKTQLMELRKSMNPRMNNECKDSPTEFRLNQDYKYEENINPIFKNSLKARDRGKRSRPPVMFKRGMDVTPFELSTIYESDTSNSCLSSIEKKNLRCFNGEHLKALRESAEEETSQRIKEKTAANPESQMQFLSMKMENANASRPTEIINDKNSFRSSTTDVNNYDSWSYALMNERGITEQSCITFNDTDITMRSSPIQSQVLSPISDWKLCKVFVESPLVQSPSTKKSEDEVSVTDSLLSFQKHELSACLSEYDTP